MHFEVRELKGVIIVGIEGEIRVSTQDDFKNYLEKISEDYKNRIVLLDLEKVSYMNSAGIGTIIETFKNFRKTAGKIALSGLTTNINKLFEVTKLNKFIEIYSNVDDAVSKLVI